MCGKTTADVSGPFAKFLEYLGDRVELKGWKKFRAGLDVNRKQALPPSPDNPVLILCVSCLGPHVLQTA